MPKSFRGERGQYLVEFALAFTMFVMFVIFVIDIGLVIYNHSVFYRGVSIGAREASLGASNQEIETAVGNFVEDRYLPGIFSVAHPSEGVQVEPDDEIDRVDGRIVIVNMDAEFGISLLQFFPLTIELPIRSRELIVQDNDDDRDGLKDSLEANPQDHNNNGIVDELRFDGPDPDADGDGVGWASDTVAIAFVDPAAPFNCQGYLIYRPNASAGSRTSTCTFNGNPNWEQWFEGTYHAPEIWDDNSVALPKLYERRLPNWSVLNNGSIFFIKRTLRTAYDEDNDGWEDKYDDVDTDPLQH